MQAAGLKVSQIANHLGINRRRIDKWVRLDTFPERSRMQPRPGMAESFRDYLRQRWDAGIRHGRTLFAEIQELGYFGGFSNLAQLLSAWRQPVEAATATQRPCRRRLRKSKHSNRMKQHRQQQDRFRHKWRRRC